MTMKPILSKPGNGVRFFLPAIVLLIPVLLSMGCQAGKPAYQGRVVAEENRIDLPADAAQEGNWRTRDVTVAYAAQRREEALALSGDVTFANHLLNGYVDIRFTLRINFFDGEGVVIGGSAIPLPRYSIYRPVLTFSKQVPLPAGARGFTFSYNGKAYDQGKHSGVGPRRERGFVWNFWKGP